MNNSDFPFAFDGYTLACEAGCLDPDGWVSISDAAGADILRVISALGAGGATMGEANPTANKLSELTLNAAGSVIQPHSRWSLGFPVSGSVDYVAQAISSGVMTFSISAVDFGLFSSSGGFLSSNGVLPVPDGAFGIEFVPEPNALLLAAVGVPSLLLMRRRRK